MSRGFGLVVRFTARDLDAVRGFDDLVRRTVTGIREREPGTLAYVVHSVPEEPLVRVFYELYADRDAFEAHEQQPHTKVFLEERHQYLAATEVTFLNAEFGKGPAQ
ncbi:putative quinol monooxygenase [Actinoplanes xinjiangensis]|uniref:Quinol monooxygenase YgiN n=1 Tax=Actinoplanes xinjiangensis TaxID=512350 RepID=A0A316FPI4_9ACTN|nr:antibiotic biosynthesis monooxygenase [Actinoplanes xinjiangensis]PWK49600.1 quinol monooxygenase YgiN [Actinoplanes xinjiangensis]GIF37605.1 hypothetical protein Axi01nite_19160 [Actinoplanes xinjiangensis]